MRHEDESKEFVRGRDGRTVERNSSQAGRGDTASFLACVFLRNVSDPDVDDRRPTSDNNGK